MPNDTALSANLAIAPLMPITARPAAVMARGAGSYLWDESGARYLDFLQGWAVNCLGHCPPEVTAAICTQANTLITPSPALHNRPQIELASRLTRASGLTQAHFLNSGAEANEAAVKLARKWGRVHKRGAYRVITTSNSFHGRTLAMMAASGKPGWRDLFPPYPPGFDIVPFDDVDAVRDAIRDDTVAIMVEPVQGEAGVVVPAPGYLSALREIADACGLLLIFDEIQTGIGRTGHLFGFEREGARPDVMTLGKGLGGGVPIAAVLANARASCFEYGDQGGTYNGNPLVTAVANAVLDVVAEPSFLAAVSARGAELEAGLLRLGADAGIVEVRGRGLLWAARLAEARAARVVEAAFDRGLLVNAARPDTLRFMPSLRVTTTELAEFFECLEASLAAAGQVRGSSVAHFSG